MPSAAARGAKSRPKRPRSAKQGAELREGNPQLPEHDDAETVDTEPRAAETVQHEKKSNGGFQGLVQSDEDDTEDELGAPSGDDPGDTVNKGNDCFDETETSWLVMHL